MSNFTKILDVCLKYGFLRQVKPDQLQVDSIGALLQTNIRNEWFNNVVINKDLSVFICKTNLQDTVEFANKFCLNKAPFGVTQKIATNSAKTDNFFANFFTENAILRCSYFVSPPESTHFFHNLQKQRRMWWRMFSASPGRYYLSDTKTKDNSQSVEIYAKYPWNEQLIESVHLYTCGHPDLGLNQLQVKSGRKDVTAHCVIDDVCLPSMFLNILCDSYEEVKFQDDLRLLLRLHRKLAPYKISFAIASSNSSSVVQELKELALFICRQLRSSQISSFFTPVSYSFNLETQWRQYDQMGIPYCVLLNENTLKNGVVLLRSRDTTLKEQVHVSVLVDYVEKLFKNY